MIRRTPRSTRTDTRCPCTTLCRSPLDREARILACGVVHDLHQRRTAFAPVVGVVVADPQVDVLVLCADRGIRVGELLARDALAAEPGHQDRKSTRLNSSH